MNTPEKSSDEILKELFGLCQQQRRVASDTSSQAESSDSNDDKEDVDIQQKKHKRKKKKKKKQKKVKKRKNESMDSEELESKHRKRKLKKIKKEPGVNDETVLEVSKVELKIKTEKEDAETVPCEKFTSGESSQNKENKSNNYINIVTGMPTTLDDVFNTLGIVTEEKAMLNVKQEKIEDLLRPEQIKKEKFDENDESTRVKEEKKTVDDRTTDGKSKSEPLEEHATISTDGKPKNAAVFETITDDTDKQATSSKKISIKNLKNSSIYEATMKEIEEREKERAEKYEEGELTTDSSSSEDDSVNLDLEDENSRESQNQLLDEPKKKHKSHEKKKKKHRSHSRKKKHRHEESRNERKSHKRHKGLEHDHHSRSDYSRNYSHRYYYEDRSSRSLEKESDLISKRSRRFAYRSGKERSALDRSRSRSHSRAKSNHRKLESESVEKIDKQKLLEIARKNAINLLQQGALPASVVTSKIASIKAGGKTVDELTDFCKQLSRKEAEGYDSDHLSSESESGDAKVAFHHPFQLRERPSGIVMNIRNAISLPTKTAQEKTLELSKQLSLQYPVSSGQHHQSEWVPVEKTQESIMAPRNSSSYSKAIVDPAVSVSYPTPQTVSYPMPVVPYRPPLPPANSILPAPKNIDISNIVAQRLEAIRRLSENPQDPLGTNLIQAADSEMTVWAESKVQPGLFTGSTGVKPLSVAELSGGFKAWPKKNQFIAAKPVYSDKGEALMKKMGWQPGEGLGKYKQGPAIPCEISMKTDRKGLAEQPVAKGFKQTISVQKAIEMTQNKHPVSLLNEFCSRKKLPTPQYDCDEKDVGKRKLFLFSVTVQGVRYTPQMPSPNKKQSKMEAASICLQTLGLVPVIATSNVQQ